MAFPRHRVSVLIILELVPSFRKENSRCSFRVADIVTYDVAHSQLPCKYDVHLPTEITVKILPHNKNCKLR